MKIYGSHRDLTIDNAHPLWVVCMNIYAYDTGKKEQRSQLPESEDKLPSIN